jgi:DNA adenine methylase
MSATFAKAMIENNEITLSSKETQALLNLNSATDHFVANTFRVLYFSYEENELIDMIRANIK